MLGDMAGAEDDLTELEDEETQSQTQTEPGRAKRKYYRDKFLKNYESNDYLNQIEKFRKKIKNK